MSSNNPDIYHARLSHGLALAWVNSYSAAVVKTPGVTLLFDPVSMEVPDDCTLDLIAVSHGHSDHWDPELVVRLQQRTQPIIATSQFLADRLNSAPLPDKVSSSAKPALSTNVARILHSFPPQGETNGNTGCSDTSDGRYANWVLPLQPGDKLKIGDVTVTALRCDHPAVEPLAFLVETDEGITVYLPGDTTPYPEMDALVDDGPLPRSRSLRENDGSDAEMRVDILLWMGTALEDGARIAQLVRPKIFLTYSIKPPAAGSRAKDILTRYAPDLPFQALDRHQVFLYP